MLAAGDYNAIFENAVKAVDFDFRERWAFTETRLDSEHVWVGRFDPRRPKNESWQLLSVDDRDPTEKEFREYLKDKKHDHSDKDDDRLEAMVEPDSVRLIGETGDYWLLGFNPGEEDKDFVDSLDATIRIDKANGHLEYIDLRTNSGFKPATGIKIARLVTRLTFGPAIEGGLWCRYPHRSM